jgi:hypothetical protein
MRKEVISRTNCDYREVLRKQRLQNHERLSQKHDKLYNWNIFDYGNITTKYDIEFGISKNEHLISNKVNKIRLNEHLIKYGED